jgi:predicted enzyme related to lactoylglutathione lyase
MIGLMPEPDHIAPGLFCWVELATSDQSGAKAFYNRLFGWQSADSPIGDGQTYTMLSLRSRHVGALYQQDPRQGDQGIPAHWLSYVAVESADETAKKVISLGGTAIASPFDVMDVGRMAVVNDTGGATFALWQARRHQGYGIVNEPGAVCWHELMTGDTGVGTHFYTNLFDWDTEVMSMPDGAYTMFTKGGVRAGGMMKMPPRAGQAPAHWLVYFCVIDCLDAVASAEHLGGRTLVAPTDVPNVGQFAILQDPQGAMFGVLRRRATG